MLKSPIDTPPKDLILFQSTNQWALDEYQRNMTQYYRGNTLVCYSSHLIKFLDFCGKPIQSITSQEIKKFMSYHFGLGKKKATVSFYLKSIKSFMRYLHEWGFISYNPAEKIKYPKIDVKLPMSLSEQDLQKLLGAANNHLRDRAIILLLYCTGVRVSEIANIELSDINWKRHKILIRESKSNKQRFVFFSEICGQMLLAYLDSRNDVGQLLFLTKKYRGLSSRGLSIRSFRGIIKHYVRKAGLDSKISMHWFRRTFAQQLINKGMEDQEICVLVLRIIFWAFY